MPKIKLSREPESNLAKMSNRDLVRITRQRCKLSIKNTHVGKYLKELLSRIEKLEPENETKVFPWRTQKTCPMCEGTGLNLLGEQPKSHTLCEYCNGKGTLSCARFLCLMKYLGREKK